MCYAEAASPRITETSICAAQQLFNSSCWAVSRFSSGGILASAASKVPPTDCLGAKILPQNPQNSQKLLLGIFSHRFHRSAQIVWARRFSHRFHRSTQIVWVRRFSHRFHRIHRNSCWGYSPTDFTDLHRLFGCEDSPTDFTDLHRLFGCVDSPTDFTDLHRLFGCLQGGALVSSAPTEQEVHQPSKKCTNVARLGVCQNSQAVRPEGAEAHSPGQRPGYFVFIMNNAPCKGNTLIIRLLPLQGVGLVWRIFTQGVALGYVLLPLQVGCSKSL